MSTETPTAPISPDHGDAPNEGVFLNTDTQVIDRPEVKRKRWVKPVAVGASVLAAGGLTWAAVGGRGEAKQRATPPVAASSPTPGTSSEAPTAPSTATTPAATESEPLTASQQVESLTLPTSLYDPTLMKELQATDSDMQRIKTHFADRYPDISSKFDDALTSHENAFGTLTSDVIVGAQERFNKALASTIYDEKSLEAGRPTLVTVGEHFSSGEYSNASFTLPNGIMPPNLITEYAAKAKANHLPADQSIQSFLAQQIDSAGTDWSFLSNIAQNEAHTTNYFSHLSQDERQKFSAPTSSSIEFLQAHYLYPQPAGNLQPLVTKASNPNNSYAGCGESFIVKVSNEDVTYGPTSIPINGLTLACEEKGQFVLESVVLLPVDSYYQGKKTNKSVLQPFVLQTDTFSGIQKAS